MEREKGVGWREDRKRKVRKNVWIIHLKRQSQKRMGKINRSIISNNEHHAH